MKLKLYGIVVEAAEYQELKRLADALIGFTSTVTAKKKALTECVYIALWAREKARKV